MFILHYVTNVLETFLPPSFPWVSLEATTEGDDMVSRSEGLLGRGDGVTPATLSSPTGTLTTETPCIEGIKIGLESFADRNIGHRNKGRKKGKKKVNLTLDMSLYVSCVHLLTYIIIFRF